MDFIDIILKLIELFGLSDTENQRQLTVDCDKWRSTCTVDSEDKMKAMYAKLHQGPWVRLANPFLYFFLAKKMKNVLKDEDEDFD